MPSSAKEGRMDWVRHFLLPILLETLKAWQEVVEDLLRQHRDSQDEPQDLPADETRLWAACTQRPRRRTAP